MSLDTNICRFLYRYKYI